MALKKIDLDSFKKYDSEDIEFEVKGDRVEGHLVERVTLTSKKGKQFQKYTAKVSDGTYVSFLGSHKIDKGLKNAPIGAFFTMLYTGSKRLDNGNNLKEFEIEIDDENVIPVDASTAPVSAKDTIAAMRAS